MHTDLDNLPNNTSHSSTKHDNNQLQKLRISQLQLGVRIHHFCKSKYYCTMLLQCALPISTITTIGIVPSYVYSGTPSNHIRECLQSLSVSAVNDGVLKKTLMLRLCKHDCISGRLHDVEA